MSAITNLFTTTHLPIRKFFGDTDSYYQIPEYQRSYQWVNTQLDELWSDLWDAFNEEPNKAYFLGAIITTKPKKTKKDYKDVVDGQQRITTLMILFCVIRDLYPNINKDNKYAIQQEDIINCIRRKTQRLVFHTQSSAHSDFEQLVLNEKATNTPPPEPNIKDLNKDKSKPKFINSVYFFKDKLKELHEERKLGAFIDFLFDKVVVIVINCNDVNSAVKLFQVINSRGLDLTTADLIKSFLRRKIRDSKDKQSISNNEAQFKSDWENIEGNIESSNINMDELLYMYQYYSKAEPEKFLYPKLEKFFKYQFEKGLQPPTPNRAIAEIKCFSQHYSKLFAENENKEIFSLRYIPWTRLWRSILLTAMYKNYKYIDELQKELRKFYYIHWIAGKNLSHVRGPSFEIIKSIKKGDTVENIFKMAYSHNKYTKKDLIKKVGKKLQENDIEDEKWCKPLLLLIEYTKMEKTSESFIKLNSNIHLEHVMPTNFPVGKKGWEYITEKVEKKYLNSGGNLTLLRGKKNIDASNKPFIEKIKIYKGCKDRTMTSFNISRVIAEGQYGKKWDENAMEKRKEWFLKEAGEVLGIEISPESDS